MFLVDWPGGSWEVVATSVGLVIGAYIALLWMAMVFWTVHSFLRHCPNCAAPAIGILPVSPPGKANVSIQPQRSTLGVTNSCRLPHPQRI